MNDDEKDDGPRANSPEDLGWTAEALTRGPRRPPVPEPPIPARSAAAQIEAWLRGEEP